MITHCAFHRGIVAFARCSKVSPVPVNNFTRFTEVNLAIMNLSSCSLKSTYQTIIHISYSMQFMTIIGFTMFFSPFTVFITSGFNFRPTRLIHSLMTRISRNERGILNNAFLDF